MQHRLNSLRKDEDDNDISDVSSLKSDSSESSISPYTKKEYKGLVKRLDKLKTRPSFEKTEKYAPDNLAIDTIVSDSDSNNSSECSTYISKLIKDYDKNNLINNNPSNNNININKTESDEDIVLTDDNSLKPTIINNNNDKVDSVNNEKKADQPYMTWSDRYRLEILASESDSDNNSDKIVPKKVEKASPKTIKDFEKSIEPLKHRVVYGCCKRDLILLEKARKRIEKARSMEKNGKILPNDFFDEINQQLNQINYDD